ncbi:hypothetical protein M0804_015082 [Polistes exclamans]|nr:hypothetical protein M0804_015082 [Polistes exclamans]
MAVSETCVQINMSHSRGAQELLVLRMREDRVGMAIIAEPWWVPPGNENWFSSLGGAPLAAVLLGESGRPCSLTCRGSFFVAVKWGDLLVVSVYFPPSEVIDRFSRLLDEFFGRYPTLPALVAGDLNARAPRWDPEGRRNLRGELLCLWANRLDLHLSNQVGRPMHEATGVRSLRPQDKTFPRWNLRAVDNDVLAAALISGEWTRPGNADRSRVLVKCIRQTLRSACDMAMPKIIGKKDGRGKVSWWSQKLTALRAAATAARRRYLRSRRRGDQEKDGTLPGRPKDCQEEPEAGHQEGQDPGLPGVSGYAGVGSVRQTLPTCHGKAEAVRGSGYRGAGTGRALPCVGGSLLTG